MSRVLSLLLAVVSLMALSCSREESTRHSGDGHTFHATYTNFSSEIVLDSYATIEVHGHTLMVLTWRAPYDRPRDNYTVFVHAIDKEGKILFQFDHSLVDRAGRPTMFWEQEPAKDVFQLTPPAGHPPGKYTLRIGLFVPSSGRQLELFATDLPAPSDGWRNVAVLLANIDCR